MAAKSCAPHEVPKEGDENGQEACERHIAAAHDRARQGRPICKPMLARRNPALHSLKDRLCKHLRAHVFYSVIHCSLRASLTPRWGIPLPYI
jgi:hypothetical protein